MTPSDRFNDLQRQGFMRAADPKKPRKLSKQERAEYDARAKLQVEANDRRMASWFSEDDA